MALTNDRKFHIAMFPWLAMGHMIPYLHLSNQLAQRGHQISLLFPQKAQLKLQHMNLHPNLITFHDVVVPHVDGLPLGTETASEIPISLNGLLYTAMDLMRDQIEALLRSLKPDFVFFDFAHWVPELAAHIGFKTVCYNLIGVAAVANIFVPARVVSKDKPPTAAELAVPPQGYPSSTVVLLPHETQMASVVLSLESLDGLTLHARVSAAMKHCDALAFSTCQELQGDMCDYVISQYKKPLLLTGPVLPEPAKTPLEDRWANWLDRFEPGSVVFCSFGSQLILEEKNQFQELVLGLELTGLPFLVALKQPSGFATIEEALPEGFEERVRGRGVVYGGWVQQPLILGHSSVGCFVNHCGFGSMWESLMSDSQIVFIPHLGDQSLNTRLLVEELKVAVEVEREENRWFSKESLCKAIESVMEKDSEVGRLVKKNHAKWKKTLVSPGFLSDYIDKFIQNLHDL